MLKLLRIPKERASGMRLVIARDADCLFVDDDYDETVLQELERELYTLFRCCWGNLGPRRLKARAFLRKHDDIAAMDLKSGKIVQDKDRDWKGTHDL